MACSASEQHGSTFVSIRNCTGSGLSILFMLKHWHPFFIGKVRELCSWEFYEVPPIKSLFSRTVNASADLEVPKRSISSFQADLLANRCWPKQMLPKTQHFFNHSEIPAFCSHFFPMSSLAWPRNTMYLLPPQCLLERKGQDKAQTVIITAAPLGPHSNMTVCFPTAQMRRAGSWPWKALRELCCSGHGIGKDHIMRAWL